MLTTISVIVLSIICVILITALIKVVTSKNKDKNLYSQVMYKIWVREFEWACQRYAELNNKLVPVVTFANSFELKQIIIRNPDTSKSIGDRLIIVTFDEKDPFFVSAKHYIGYEEVKKYQYPLDGLQWNPLAIVNDELGQYFLVILAEETVAASV